ncbi:nitroreductase family protein [Haloferula rosea]|uniref:Nitroreductase family protein n=1 Tax=Haloferula rosea TaxID=490093 RepID=A0A934R8R8_9BACT|nr:nitroreductase family protein [Haloferula rosea]MBK1826387.1 nitroreductase family protein [Haloferula rosea]
MADTHRLDFTRLTPSEMQHQARTFSTHLRRRRSVRDFSEDPIPDGIIEDCLLAAGSAPNGANLQPWHFAVITRPDTKRAIRVAAEAEEREFYGGRAPQDWLDTLAPLGTDASKPFLEHAPALIAIFQQSQTLDAEGRETKTYYPKESVGIATGFLIAALHQAGLTTLTHTPSPMRFLNEILHRPASEKPFLLLVVGYPADDCHVPVITKKPLDEIASWH